MCSRHRLLVAALIIIGCVGCDPFHAEFEPTEPAVMYVASELTEAEDPSALRVMTWNVKFGGGRIDFLIVNPATHPLMKTRSLSYRLPRYA